MSELYFRGPMLFMMSGGTLQEVRIPDATRLPIDFVHPDGSPASVHFASMLIVGPAEPRRVDVRGALVTITDGSSVLSDASDASLDAMINVKGLTDNGLSGPLTPIPNDKSFFDHCAAKLVILGGRLTADNLTRDTWALSDQFSKAPSAINRKLPMRIVWTPGNPASVTITIDRQGAKQVIDLQQNEVAHFYNWDTTDPATRPEKDELEDFAEAPTQLADIDFKWVYQTLAPVSGWHAWLGASAAQLPHPVPTHSSAAYTAPGKLCINALHRP